MHLAETITQDLIMISSISARRRHYNFSFSPELNRQLITSRPCFQSATQAAYVPRTTGTPSAGKMELPTFLLVSPAARRPTAVGKTP